MADVTATMVKDLREKTGAGMMDCKAALGETQGDMEAAVDWLRKKGLSKAAKKAGRTAAEGLIGVAAQGAKGAIVEVNSETDFVARNNQFQNMVAGIAGLALNAGGDVAKLAKTPFPGTGYDVEGQVSHLSSTISEKMTLRRTAAFNVSPGVVATYVHNQVAPNLGKIGVLVALKSSGNAEKLAALGRQIAMHVAAANPLALKPEQIDSATIEREKAIFADQARASGKPENIIAKMAEAACASSMRKWSCSSRPSSWTLRRPSTPSLRPPKRMWARPSQSRGLCATPLAKVSRKRKLTSPPKSPPQPKAEEPKRARANDISADLPPGPLEDFR